MLHLNDVVYGNTVAVWAFTSILALGLTGGLLLARLAALRYLAGPRRWKDALLERYLTAITGRTHALFLGAISIALASQIPTLPPRPARLLLLLGPMALLLQAALWGNLTVGFWLEAPFKDAQDRAAAARASVVTFLLRLALWSLALLAALSVLGINITTILASLGIGGIAAALAVQNILGDLFASLSITLDKPFIVGDFIVVEEYLGVVEYVGLKTTRVRSLSGEQIIFANADLLKSRIRNFKRMTDRRVAFTISVAFETGPDPLERIPEAIRRIIESRAMTRFDRAHLKEFTERGFLFEVVYFVLAPDQNLYMDIQQAINFAMYRYLRSEGVEFASPRRPARLPVSSHRAASRLTDGPAPAPGPAAPGAS